MSEHFLKNIDIIDYKCFKNFKVKDFKRVNLISGKNNVGKTAFMEAIYINAHSTEIKSLTNALDQVVFSRDNLEYTDNIHLLHNTQKRIDKIIKYESKSNVNKIKFNTLETEISNQYEFDINNKSTIVDTSAFSYKREDKQNIYYIDNFGLTNQNIVTIYSAVQKSEKENELNKILNQFDPTINSFKIIDSKPQCKQINTTNYRDINEFGDGLKHYISIIIALYNCKDGYLFIDEIDNGIHYTQLERLWEIIFTISKEVNCQVFATTHSLEMIKAYAKVSSKLEEEDIAFIELGRNKENEIKANVYDNKMFLYEIEQNHEVRGW